MSWPSLQKARYVCLISLWGRMNGVFFMSNSQVNSTLLKSQKGALSPTILSSQEAMTGMRLTEPAMGYHQIGV